MATHCSILAWRISGTEEPSGLPVYGVAQSRTQLKQLSSSSSALSRSKGPRDCQQSEISQKEKNKYRILMHVGGI